MPPGRYSRHIYTFGYKDSADRLMLSDRKRYFYRPFSDNRHHVAVEGDALWFLAARFFKPLPRPAGLFWIIADFQPEPIHDPTIELDGGRLIIIPSLRTVVEEIFNDSRRELGT